MKNLIYSIATVFLTFNLSAQTSDSLSNNEQIVIADTLTNNENNIANDSLLTKEDSLPSYGGAFKKGDVDISIDYIAEFGSNKASHGIQAQGEYGLLPFLGVAVYIGNTANTSTIEDAEASFLPTQYDVHTNIFSAGAKALFHFGYLLHNLPQNMDLYGGIGAGVVSSSITYDNPSGIVYNNPFKDYSETEFTSGINIGYKYYVTKLIGFNAEVYATYNGYTTGQIGVNFKF